MICKRWCVWGVCVCVCVREREREREKVLRKQLRENRQYLSLVTFTLIISNRIQFTNVFLCKIGCNYILACWGFCWLVEEMLQGNENIC